MAPKYSVLEPKPRQPSYMLRFLLLMIAVKTVSIRNYYCETYTYCNLKRVNYSRLRVGRTDAI